MNIYIIIILIIFGILILSKIIKFIVEYNLGFHSIITDKDTYVESGYYETRIDMKDLKSRTKYVIYTKNNYYYVDFDTYYFLNIGDDIFIKKGVIVKK